MDEEKDRHGPKIGWRDKKREYKEEFVVSSVYVGCPTTSLEPNH